MIDRPIFIIGCNRSGTTLLFRNLSMHPDLWSLYIESQDEFYRHWPIDPEQGDRVAELPAPKVADALARDLYHSAHNKEQFRDAPVLGAIPPKLLQRPLGVLWKRPPIRLVEKTPANTLRVPMLARVFPDARFVFIVRRGEDVVSSLMEGWKNWSETEDESAWRYTKWHYLVPPGWQEWTGRPLEDICTFQWTSSTETAKTDLERWAPDRYVELRHEDLIADPTAGYRRIAEFCDLRASKSFDRVIESATDRLFTTGGSKPRSDKWKRLHYAEIMRVREKIEALNAKYYEDPEIDTAPILRT
ncbi:MAG: sulfotransferase family protein [Gemmatimonadota bacterium]